MPLPELLTLVRHGESEGNIAVGASRHGEDKYFTDEYRNRHSSLLRLTDVGVEQVKKTSQWMAANIPSPFTNFWVSPYLRAIETAGYLGIKNANWRIDVRLRERDFGDWDMNSYTDRMADVASRASASRRTLEGIYWRPPNGDSIANDLSREISTLLHDWSHLPRNPTGPRSLIAVTHSDKIQAFQLALGSGDVMDQKSLVYPLFTHCHIVQYSRYHPVLGIVSDRYVAVRSIPTEQKDPSEYPWHVIEDGTWSNETLLNYATSFPRVISGGVK